jgi:hypothetical protein
MRTITETKQIRMFDECDAPLKVTILQKHRNTFLTGDWESPIVEGFSENLKARGFLINKLRYDTEDFQGAGASFEGEVDVKKFIETLNHDNIKNRYKPILELIKNFDLDQYLYVFNDMTSGNHSNACTVSFFTDDTNEIEHGDLIFEIHNLIEHTQQNICDEAFKNIMQYKNELLSDEYIAEYFSENEVEFDEQGNIFSEEI